MVIFINPWDSRGSHLRHIASPLLMLNTGVHASLNAVSKWKKQANLRLASDIPGGMGDFSEIKCSDDIIKAPEDKRCYRALELSNKLRVLLVSDPETEKAAAAIDVNVGYLSDPDEVPGLAHFCEHMLFLGTEKYQDINEYSKYISEHGGHNNATTLADHTVYYFDIMSDYLEGALDRFAQFFICPLFTEDATEKEINAVNSEFEKNYAKDLWRLDQIEKYAAKKDHPYRKFGTGNLQTLSTVPKSKGINIRDELRKFHDKWYSSNIMTLAILGKEDLDELEKLAVSLFSGIKNNDAEHLEWTDHPYGPEQVQCKGYVVPNKDLRSLSVSFPVPDYSSHYRSKPFYYISGLIGHEGPGSLLSALKKKGWSDKLVSGYRTGAKGFGFFFVKVDLTQEGIEHIDDIVELFFQYVKMLKEEGLQKWFFEESKKILETTYRFKEKEKPYSYVIKLASNMHMYPIKEVIVAPYLLDVWDPDLITTLLNNIKPTEAMLVVVGQKFESIADQNEPWYGTKYKYEKISDDTIKKWEECKINPELKLPEVNDFITNNFEIFPLEENNPHPVIIHESPFTRVWFKQDNEFFMPRANLYFELFSPLASLEPLSVNMSYLYVKLVEDSLNEYSYPAELAGLKWHLRNTDYGLILTVDGYNDKQAVLLERILDRMTNLKIERERFAILLENYIRSLKNFVVEQPYEQAMWYLSILMSEHGWVPDDLLEATEMLSFEEINKFIPRLLSTFHVECLIHGNVTKVNALKLANIVENSLTRTLRRPLLPSQLLRRREIHMSDGSNFVYTLSNKYHKSSCTEAYYQCCVLSTRNNMLMELLIQIISDPIVDTLRTKEQLGYLVSSGLRRSCCAQGLRVIIQSERSPKYLEERIEAFLVSFRAMLGNMDEKEFETHKESLANTRLEKPKTLAALTYKYWHEISIQQYHFNRVEDEVAYLKTITKEDLLEFFDNFIAHGAPKRRKLSIHVLSELNEETRNAKTSPPSSETSNAEFPAESVPIHIGNITSFKSSQGLYPLVQPHVSINLMERKSKL